MIVLDASVLIAHLDAGDAHHVRASALLAEVVGERLGASPLTLAEVLVGPARVGALERAISALDLLDVASVALPADAPVRLARLRAETGLKLPDCSVLLACGQARADLRGMATFDDRLGAAGRSLGFAVIGRQPDGDPSGL